MRFPIWTLTAALFSPRLPDWLSPRGTDGTRLTVRPDFMAPSSPCLKIASNPSGWVLQAEVWRSSEAIANGNTTQLKAD